MRAKACGGSQAKSFGPSPVSGMGGDATVKSAGLPLLRAALAVAAAWVAIMGLAATDDNSLATRPDLLTPQEVRWLADHPLIRIAPTPGYQPIEFFDDAGHYSGITADYFKLIEQRLGCRFTVVRPTPDQWLLLDPDARGADVITASAETPNRREYWSFTAPYLTLPTFVITRESAEDGLTLDRLDGLRVAVVAGWAAEEFLRASYTNLVIEPVADAATGLQKVSFGLVDAFVSGLPVTTTWMERKGISNLKISAEAGFTYRLGISVRKDWPELRAMLDKALAAITPEEREQIFNRWVKLKTPLDRRREKLARYLGWSAAGLAALLVGFVVWNRLLMARVRAGTRELREELARRGQAESALRASEEKFAKAFRSSPLAISISSLADGRFVEVNEAFLQMHGQASREAVIGRTAVELGVWLDPDERERVVRQLRTHRRILNYQHAFRRTSGQLGMGLYSAEIIEIGGQEFLIALASDITERTAAEQARSESEERLRLALDAAHMGSFDWDIPQNRITWSHWHEELWGYAPGEFDGSYEAFARRVHPDDLAGLNTDLARCQAERAAFGSEFRVIWTDESVHWIASTGRFEFGVDGKPIRMRGTVREITAQKQAEQRLRESENRHRFLFEHNPMPMLIYERGTLQMLAVNEAFVQHYGYSVEEALKLRLTDLYPEEEKARIAALIPQLRGHVNVGEWRHRKRDGTFITIVACSHDLTYKGRDARVAVLTDISERKQMEEALRHSEEQFRLIMENLADLVAVVDLEGRRIYNSPSYQAILGDPDRLRGTSSFEQVHPEDRALVQEAFQETIRTGVGQRLEYRLVGQDDEARYIESQGSVIRDAQGQVSQVVVVSRDVTERRRIEAATRLSAERWQTTFDAINDGVCLLDRQFRIQQCNQAMARLLDKSPAEIAGQQCWRLMHGSGQPVSGCPAAAMLASRRRETLELERQGRWYVVTADPIFDQRGEIVGAVHTLVDVTERKRAEAARRESEQNYRELVEHANSIILRWNAAGHITFLNEFGLRFFGYSAEEVFGRHVLGTVVPLAETGGRDLQHLMQEICANPAAFEQNINENMRRNGERVWIAWTNKVVRDAGGQAIEILSIGTDVTARRRAEEQVRRLNEELQHHAAELEEHVAERTQELQALSLRQQALAEIELAINQPHELRAVLDQIVQHVTRLLPASGGASVILWDEAQQCFDLCATTVPRQSAQEAAQRIRPRGGATRWIVEQRQPLIVPDVREDPRGANPMLAEYGLRAYAGFPLLNDGRVLGVLYVQSKETHPFAGDDRDFLEAMASRAAAAISKVRMYEELAQAKTQAEAADRLKSAFLATMSHELRTPLNSIIGFTGIMLQGLAGPLNPEQTKQLGMVQGSARHLLALINDVLDISKIEAGQLEVRAEPFDVRASLEKVAGLVKPLAEKKRLALRVNLSPTIGQAVSDRVRVEQVLLNLLNNAIKFTERGEVGLVAEAVPDFKSRTHRVPQPAIRMRVVDTGIGIKPEDLTKLFQPFRQIDTGLTRQHEGTGLGLAICRRLAEMLGGEISVKSTWGEGSTFTFVVPVTRANEP